MKTSFYFVLWIVIYPILGLFDNQFIYNNSFFVALAAVWGLSWWLNKMMPKTLEYERVSQIAPIMENIYAGNVQAFIKRLTGETRVEALTSIYFLVTTAVVAYAVFKAGVNDWVALIVFGFFTFGAISRSIKLNNALSQVKGNPTPEQCAETAEEIYQLNYEAYYEGRQQVAYEQMLPPRPRYFKAFQIFSIVIAGVCALLGLLYIVLAIIGMIANQGFAFGAISVMYLLYGSLATYFGIKDFFATISSLKAAKSTIILKDNGMND